MLKIGNFEAAENLEQSKFTEPTDQQSVPTEADKKKLDRPTNNVEDKISTESQPQATGKERLRDTSPKEFSQIKCHEGNKNDGEILNQQQDKLQISGKDLKSTTPSNDEIGKRNNLQQKDEHDWMRPEDRAELNRLYQSGELEPTTEYSTTEPKEGKKHLPTENTGQFSGERGNSTFYPSSPKAQDVLKKYGQDGVEYRNGNPDFSPFTKHDSPWGETDTNVKIGHMTDQRENPQYEFGRRSDGHEPSADLGNFAQADNSLANRIKADNPGSAITGKDIEDWRKSNNLTWHELPDGESMQLVPRDLHDSCRHSGGVSEMRYLMAMGNYSPEK